MTQIKQNLQLYTRIPDPKTKHQRGFNAKTYISIQDRVNNDPEYEIQYIDELIQKGWYKLADNNSILKDEMKGRHFKYRLNGNSLSEAEKGTFRSGGIIIGRKELDNNFILYKSYSGAIFPLQISDIEEIYMKDPNKKIIGTNKEKQIKSTVFFNEPTNETPFPVYLTCKFTGKEVVVYYAKDSYSKDRFTGTKKYDYAYKTKDWGFK